MQRKRKYTEAVHAKRVQKVIEKEEPGNHCPAQKNYGVNTGHRGLLWMGAKDNSSFVKACCTICKGFIGLRVAGRLCPCRKLGEKEAIKRTRQTLKEKGYL